MQDRLDRGAEAVDIEPVEASLAIGVADRGVDLLQPVEELCHLSVAPHPRWEAGEDGFGQHRTGQAAHVGVVHRGIGPVGLDGDDVEAMPIDQHLGDARPRLVELRGAMGRLAKHDDATTAEPLDQIAQLVQIAEGLRGLRHEPAHTVVDGERALGRQEQPSGKA